MEKLWEKPELTVLLRGQPEEVLTNGCKLVGATSFYLSSSNSQGCGEGTKPGNCGVCHSRDGKIS